MTYQWLSRWTVIASCLLILLPFSGYAVESPFPHYAEITTNVAFWTDIYTRYPTTQAVVHDDLRLDRIYDVIALEPYQAPGAREVNRARIKAARQKVVAILEQLAADPDVKDAECQRVAALFGAHVEARDFDQAKHRVHCQVGQRDRFRGGLVRSGAYIDQVREIIRSYGLPEDLAYLPHVESSFDINVTSKAGAAGMWQFTRSTGRLFMTVNNIVDERRDPIASTHAAAKLLKRNYERLGSWPLAITAYNHGTAGMERAKAMHGSYPAVFANYRGRAFKFASRNFYAEFLAARQVAADPAKYFGVLTLDTPQPMRFVRLGGYAAFSDLCRHLNLSRHLVKEINPALMHSVLSGRKYVPKGYVLNLPDRERFASSQHLAANLAKLYKPAQPASRFYTVKAGDTASKIARQHRVTVADLIRANRLDRRATVYIRQRLRIPQARATVSANPSQSSPDA
ncbi:Peptidoglycan-binding LysM:Lytic transglycosylase, catalytic (fragment) [Desulfosarcina cetonica]|uniref:lytic transglycosylase domain-containing protein n=1 Tax=Desulfosarcina cetonica TaxID=90730 RepID=UPI0006D255AD